MWMFFGRGGENRTHVRGFGDPRPTIERRPYSRDRDYTGWKKKRNRLACLRFVRICYDD